MVEFCLAGIPTILIMVSCVELGRGMWTYHNLANAVNMTLRYASVHGANCATGNNSCTVTIGNLVTKFLDSAPGLTSDSINATLTSTAGSVTCNPLSACASSTTVWPPSTANTTGNDISMNVTFSFASGMAIFWPTQQGVKFGTVNLPAYSKQRILF